MYHLIIPHQFFFGLKNPALANQHDFFLTAKNNQSFLHKKKKQKIIDYETEKDWVSRVALSCSKQDNEFIMAKLCLFFKFSIVPPKFCFCVWKNLIVILPWIINNKYISLILYWKNLGRKLKKLILSKKVRSRFKVTKATTKITWMNYENDYFAWMK